MPMRTKSRQPEVQDSLKIVRRDFRRVGHKTAKYMRDEIERWDHVIKAADIKLQ
jgi:hypothetical protein